MSVVRPEFGPTLPEMLGPRLRALPRAVQAALALLVVAVLVWALALRGGGAGAPNGVVIRSPIEANFLYRAPFTRLAPAAGELARVGGGGQTFSVRELRLPAYRGDAAGFLPIYTSQLEREMARAMPGFQSRYEGRANVNQIQGYEIQFQYRPRGRLVYGRRILLLPGPTARQGAELLLVAPRSPAIARVDAVGKNGPLKTSLRSFRFGTERP
ncbi:DUF1795 domain-containing protein [Baekduia soli]|uniref:DUF1795 domain-containing protein n=1 Tax=Baekduia soli TaxID=496014 RepID=A0A5B8U378_9ACTN|nr:DUF1795 domain-containing protein [Baekduia soli]QEC47519.1 DUF1795 domain-containing protein [Baekduia soli]